MRLFKAIVFLGALALAQAAAASSDSANNRFSFATDEKFSREFAVPLIVAKCTVNSAGDIWFAAVLAHGSTGQKGEDAVVACLQHYNLSGANYPGVLWGGALSEAFYSWLITSRRPLNTASFSSFKLLGRPDVQRLFLFSDCVVQRQPDEVEQLLRTTVGSPAELERLSEIAAANQECVPEGKRIRSDRASFRAAIAMLFFRRSLPTDGEGNLADPRVIH